MISVKTLVSGEIIIKDLPEKVVNIIRQVLSYDNPNYANAKRFSKNGYVGKNIPEIIQCAKLDKFGYLHVPRGTIQIIKPILEQNNISMDIIDGRSLGKPIKCNAILGLRQYQKIAQYNGIKKVQGVILLPCGGGKTVIGVSIVGKLKRTTLVVVHTKDLRDQWIESLINKIGIDPNDIGQIGDGITDIKPVTVAIVDSLLSVIKDKKLRLELKKFGICIVDEAHHVPSNTFQSVLPYLPAKWRIGLTATPEREDGQTKLMYWTMGNEIFSYEMDQLVREGYLIRATIIPIETNFEYSPEIGSTSSEYIHQLSEALINDESRNGIIVGLAIREAIRGESILILSNRRDHCKLLNQLISRDRRVSSFALTGQVRKKIRQKVLTDFRAGKINCLIATSLADEGLDVPQLSRLILALPGKAKGRTVQRVGRVMRPGKDKTSIVYDIVDVKIPTLLTRFMSRKRIYRSINAIITQNKKILINPA
jgi:superfamily II DNA or RNA helicase